MARNRDRNSRGRRGPARRTATRRPPARLSVVPAETPAPAASPAGPDDVGAEHWDDGPPPELTAAVADSLIASVAETRTALGAELVVSGVLGTVEFGVDGDEDDAADAARLLLTMIVQHAEGVGTPEALAALRVCAALGPSECRALAAAAADRLAAAGVADRPWASRVGRPEVLRAWRYGDVFGQQSSLGVLFADRGRDHALMVLVDHALGGGIKDAWVAESRQARGLRDRVMAGLADKPTAVFEDVDVATAAQWLREAVACPPCPVEEDQLEDVATHLVLVRSRAERLAEVAGLAPMVEPAAAGVAPGAVPGALGMQDPGAAARGRSAASSADVLQLKVSLRGLRPPVWRRLEVPASMTLERLHTVLQVAFGWTDSHLHCFELPAAAGAGGRHEGRVLDGPVLRSTRLGTVAAAPGNRLLYVYDFGDGWEHLIEVEERRPADPKHRYPRCTGGRRAGPPEDCGGVPGFAALCEALDDTAHPDHADLVTWAPPGYDPAHFDRSRVDTALARLR